MDSTRERISKLVQLCERVLADGELSDDELREVLRWISDNKEIDDPSIVSLVHLAKEIVADKRVTSSERRQLFQALKAIQATRPPSQSRVATEVAAPEIVSAEMVVEPFALKGDQLGMLLAEFKRKHNRTVPWRFTSSAVVF